MKKNYQQLSMSLVLCDLTDIVRTSLPSLGGGDNMGYIPGEWATNG